MRHENRSGRELIHRKESADLAYLTKAACAGCPVERDIIAPYNVKPLVPTNPLSDPEPRDYE